jgi:hypothetical protein
MGGAEEESHELDRAEHRYHGFLGNSPTLTSERSDSVLDPFVDCDASTEATASGRFRCRERSKSGRPQVAR